MTVSTGSLGGRCRRGWFGNVGGSICHKAPLIRLWLPFQWPRIYSLFAHCWIRLAAHLRIYPCPATSLIGTWVAVLGVGLMGLSQHEMLNGRHVPSDVPGPCSTGLLWLPAPRHDPFTDALPPSGHGRIRMHLYACAGANVVDAVLRLRQTVGGPGDVVRLRAGFPGGTHARMIFGRLAPASQGYARRSRFDRVKFGARGSDPMGVTSMVLAPQRNDSAPDLHIRTSRRGHISRRSGWRRSVALTAGPCVSLA
jgi:hypothetical protein